MSETKSPYTYHQNTSAIPSLLCDFYKVSHRKQYPAGTEVIYSTFTPRDNHNNPYLDRAVCFGLQGFIQKYLIDYFNDNFFQRPQAEVLQEYRDFIYRTLQQEDSGEHIKQLHQLGYLPIKIKAIAEGKSVAMKVPIMTIENTHPKFFWLTNYLETLINLCLWQPMTSASMARRCRLTFEQFAKETCDNDLHIPFQAHDFSMRGMSGLEAAEISGAGHLTAFLGTDTIPAICYIERYYGSQKLIGTSIPASEHSVMSAHGPDELSTFRHLMSLYPNTMLSIVADTTDFWHNINVNLPLLKDEIMARPEQAKVVIRPDSGDAVKLLCGDNQAKTEYEQKGLIECLWDLFGGKINQKGYKVLDGHIGAIYGDGLNYDKMEKILMGLKEKGFASSNIVFGVGSRTYQQLSRDTLGFAMKATSITINGKEQAIFKAPKTDTGLKKSQRGRVKVTSLDSYIENLNANSDFNQDLLEEIFCNGKLLKTTDFDQIRRNLGF
ncbi:nicotinamide phosphoribosyltransferase [Volucribacter psittacicida]|uniref:Nicotinamide phosphoribosyltransferase n=1 Tax=Volucribacter psittacicida TaxID=203482 RepID=A0A4R1G4G1_9PAST|nr:nicotinate phosphoribosyltransferase [Volucribacter psittacicida]TCJ98531.1 nicotinamide phosphoribosyltransferase [Volucribacter psittacicida]